MVLEKQQPRLHEEKQSIMMTIFPAFPTRSGDLSTGSAIGYRH